MVVPDSTTSGSQASPAIHNSVKRAKKNGDDREKSSSPHPSPGSSEGRRGRSRMRGTNVNNLPEEHTDVNKGKAGYHSLMSSFGKAFHVEKRWKLIREMGSGAYGYVISAVDDISGEPVAIKMVTRVFEKVQLAKRALREITLLRHFSHENITGLIDVDMSPNHDEIYIFMEPMEADLHQIVKSGQALTTEHVQYFVYQILRGLKYIHSASVVHRDLKPGNLLVNADCELKICDFGLSRGFNSAPDENATHMTEYVATRWYRAPEIMLAHRAYNTAVDIWSVGCIVAELILGRPVFKGKDYVDQLNKILEVLGSPSEEIIQKIGSDKAQAYVRSLPHKRSQPWRKVLPAADVQALDFVAQLLTFNPASRLSATSGLAHPWLSTYHDETDEPDCPYPFDKWRMIEELETLDQYKAALVNEVYECRREVRSLAAMDAKIAERSPSILSPEMGRSISPQDHRGRSPIATRADTIPEEPTEDGEMQEQANVQPSSVAFPGASADDPVVAYSRRSMFGMPTRTNSTFSIREHRPPTPNGTDAQDKDTVAFPSSAEYVLAGRHRTASMYTLGGDVNVNEFINPAGMRRLLRTLSTVSIYESGEGHAGGLADVAPIGKYIVQKDRTDDEGLPSEMPREIAGDDSAETQSPSMPGEKGGGGMKKRFRV